MRIVLFEIKKILNWKMLLMIAIMNLILYYFLIDFNIKYFPNGRPALDSYHIGVEMVEKYGPHMDEAELIDFNKKYEEEVKKADQFLQSRDDFKKAGISSYTDFQNMDHEDKGQSELHAKILFDEKVDLFWELQERERLLEFHHDQEMIIQNDIEQAAYGKERLLDIKKTGQFDLFPEVSFVNFQDIIRNIAITILMTVVVVISPIFLRDRMKRIVDLQYTAAIGRSIFLQKVAAGLIATLIVMTVLLAVYFGLYSLNNPSVFFDVPINAFIGGFYWYDLTFFEFIVLSTMAIYMLGIVFAFIAMGISSLVSNYTALIGVQVPVVFLWLAVGLNYLLSSIVSMWLPIWLVPMCYACLVAATVLFAVFLVRREKKLDIV